MERTETPVPLPWNFMLTSKRHLLRKLTTVDHGQTPDTAIFTFRVVASPL